MRRILLFLLVIASAPGLPGCQPTYDFQAVEIGAPATDPARVPRPRADGQLVRAMYADLVGRPPQVYDFTVTGPDGQELQRFPIDEAMVLVGLFDGLSDPTPLRALLAAGLLGSEEVHLPRKEAVADPADYVTVQFRRLLGRDPGAYELHAFVAAWRSDPAVGPRAVLRALVGSREYQSF